MSDPGKMVFKLKKKKILNFYDCTKLNFFNIEFKPKPLDDNTE